MGVGALLIEACEAWPEGEHHVCYVSDGEHVVPALLRAARTIRRADYPSFFPANFDPVGALSRGSVSVGTRRTVTERFADGPAFLRIWLEVVRAAFPGVRWRCDPCPALAAHDGHALHGIYAGRVVAIVAEAKL